MIYVSRDDCTPGGHLPANKLRGDWLGNPRTQGLAPVLVEEGGVGRVLRQSLQQHGLAQGHEFHLGGDNALTRIMHLAYVLTGSCATGDERRRKAQVVSQQVFFALTRIFGTRTGENLRIATLLDPVRAEVEQSTRQINALVGLRVRTGSVVDRQGRI